MAVINVFTVFAINVKKSTHRQASSLKKFEATFSKLFFIFSEYLNPLTKKINK